MFAVRSCDFFVRTEAELVRKTDVFENGFVDFLVNEGEDIIQMLGKGYACEEVKAADGPKVDEAKKEECKREYLEEIDKMNDNVDEGLEKFLMDKFCNEISVRVNWIDNERIFDMNL
jgi:hypothetical protein